MHSSRSCPSPPLSGAQIQGNVCDVCVEGGGWGKESESVFHV